MASREGGRSVAVLRRLSRHLLSGLMGAVLLAASAACGPAGGRVAKPPPPRPIQVGTIRRLAFVSQKAGWMAFSPPGNPGTLDVARTGDGGRSWVRVKLLQFQLPGEATPEAWTLNAFTADSLMLAVSQSTPQGTSVTTVLTTTDKGRRWRAATFASAVFVGRLAGAPAGPGRACLLLTSDPASGSVLAALYCGSVTAGAWHQVSSSGPPVPAQSDYGSGLIPSGLSVDGQNVWITGQNHSASADRFFTSDNGGRSFRAASVPVTIATNADTGTVVVSPGAAPAMPVTAYVPGGFAVLVYHLASGGTWRATTPLTTHTGAPPLYSAVSGQVVFVCGLNTLYATTDGGASWTPVYRTAAAWSAMQFVSATSGWAVSAAAPGVLLRTTDGGRVWTRLALRVLPAK